MTLHGRVPPDAKGSWGAARASDRGTPVALIFAGGGVVCTSVIAHAL
jgi:hypothetical protein